MTYQRHPLEIGPLVLGVVFLGIVTAWGLFELGLVSAGDASWILPVVLVGAGTLGVVLSATRSRAQTAPADTMPADTMPADTMPADTMTLGPSDTTSETYPVERDDD